MHLVRLDISFDLILINLGSCFDQSTRLSTLKKNIYIYFLSNTKKGKKSNEGEYQNIEGKTKHVPFSIRRQILDEQEEKEYDEQEKRERGEAIDVFHRLNEVVKYSSV